MKIVADNAIPFLRGVLDAYAEVRYVAGSAISRRDLLDADALLVRTRTRCSEELLHGTGVKFIGSATIGHDHIDPAYCARAGITWTTAPGCNAGSVQQYVAAAILATANRLGVPIHQATIGVVGVGNVGRLVAGVARDLGMRVLCNDPPRERIEGSGGFIPLDDLLAVSDVVSLHVPLTTGGPDATAGLIDESRFQKMKERSVIINTSRGEVVDESALAGMLRRGTMSAVLDVWAGEPQTDPRLRNLAAIATPHIAGYSVEGKAKGTAMVVNALAAHFGLPVHGWYPPELPPGKVRVLRIDGSGLTGAEILAEAIRRTYDIMEDDRRFRSAPGNFERLRAEYPVRREFSWYTVELTGEQGGAEKLLRSAGFRDVSRVR
ncbi:MAG TPA: 4-phosphoerythronate dehydrogenase [Bacteroidota bacterium]|nr:4-phosphoerythronate dehydrogenase [Bacteroidota bacterium]